MNEAPKLLLMTEGLSKVLFHYTRISQYSGILNSNKFNLSRLCDSYNADSAEEFLPAGFGYYQTYFMCFARSINSAFGAGRNYNVTLKIDGNKLSQNYPGGPLVLYQGTRGVPDEDQYEERVYSKTEYIPAAVKYILEAHIEVTLEGWATYEEKIMKSVNTVPTFLYEGLPGLVRTDYYANLRKDKSVPPEYFTKGRRNERRI